LAIHKRRDEYRNRSLREMGAKIGLGFIETFIDQRCRVSPSVRVLEIGCGEGRVLMELRKRLPTVELHGINKIPWTAMRGRESLLKTGIYSIRFFGARR